MYFQLMISDLPCCFFAWVSCWASKHKGSMDQTCPTLAQKAHLKHVICVLAPLLSTANAL